MSTALQPLIALFRNRTFVTALIGAIVAFAVGLIPTLAPYQTQIVSVVVALVLLSAGGEIVTSTATTVSTAKVEAARAEAANAPTALVQGASLKPYTLSEFTDTELRAIASKLGALAPGDVSRDTLVARIRIATAPKVAT